MNRWLVGLAAVGLVLGPSVSAGQEEKPEIARIRVGLAGQYKVGLWTPVEVTLRGGDEALTGAVVLTVPDGDGVPSRVLSPPGRPCQVLPGRETTVDLFARFGRMDSEANVQFVVEGRVVAERTFDTSFGEDETEHYAPALPSERRLLVEIGATGTGVSEAVALVPEGPERRAVVVRLTDVRQMPTRWYGYEGVEAVVISTSRPELFRKLTAGLSARVEALDRWVRMGGRLVLAVGAEGSEILDEEGPLARFAPGKLNGMAMLGRTAALEAYAGAANAAQSGQVKLQVPRLVQVEGTVEVWEEGVPVVVRAPRGFGEVVFVAADLDRPPWSTWKDRGRLAARLVGLPTKLDETEERRSTAMMGQGYNDISGQLRSCLDRFTGVRPVPFGAVVAGIVLYIVLIGPGDYFLLRRLGRFEWTWFTFPALVVAFSAAAYGLAYWLKGDQLRVNQVDLVDVDVRSGFVRGTSWANLFSPRMETYNLSLRPDLPGLATDAPSEVLFSWLGLPGEGLGGMGAGGAGFSRWRRAYAFSPELDAVRQMPIQVWSTKSLTSRWSTRWERPILAELAEEDGLPTGTLESRLDFPLQRCLLVYDRWVYELGTLEPEGTVRVDAVSSRSELKTLLTGQRLVADERGDRLRQEATPYKVSSDDAAYVLRQMMFFEAAGGQGYARLANGYQPFVDTSHLLGPDRAILVGFAPGAARAGAVLLRDGEPLVGPQDRHATAFRFLLPVTSERGRPRPVAP